MRWTGWGSHFSSTRTGKSTGGPAIRAPDGHTNTPRPFAAAAPSCPIAICSGHAARWLGGLALFHAKHHTSSSGSSSGVGGGPPLAQRLAAVALSGAAGPGPVAAEPEEPGPAAAHAFASTAAPVAPLLPNGCGVIRATLLPPLHTQVAAAAGGGGGAGGGGVGGAVAGIGIGASLRGVVVLVRPDGHVAWRAEMSAAEANSESSISALLGRKLGQCMLLVPDGRAARL
jgi:hypothetical protein